MLENLQHLLETAQQEINKGELPSYIPLLAQVDPQMIAIAIKHVNSDFVMAGDTAVNFPLMSAIKPFLLLYLLENLGGDVVFQIVDSEPSSEPFNSIPEGKPKNPMINSGAIALSSLLTSSETLQNWLNQKSGANLSLDLEMLTSVRSVANRRNLEISDRLNSLDIIFSPSRDLSVYEEICCLRGSAQDLAKIGALLVNTEMSLNIPIVLKVMTQCGMYAASAEFAKDIGLPSKSSVSGALISIMPNQAVIACYSPSLDVIGNSVAGKFMIRQVKSWLETK